MKQRGSPYSVDFRQSVLSTMKERRWTHMEAAVFFKIGKATIDRWVRLERETGALAPRPHGGGNPRSIDVRGDRALKRLVRAKPDLTLDELTERLKTVTPRGTSASSVGRALKRLGVTLKKRASSR
jgi:transposase